MCFFDSWDAVDHVSGARANRNSCDFNVKAVNALAPSKQMKTVISPTKPVVSQFFGRLLFTAALQVLPRTFRTWILQACSPAPHEHILCHGGVQRGMSTLFAFQNRQ